MKKFKKILAVLTTAAVSAVSLCSMFSASAITTRYKSYIYMFDVNIDTFIKDFYFNVSYNPTNTIITNTYSNGNLGGSLTQESTANISSSQKITYYTYHNDLPSAASGYIGSIIIDTTSVRPQLNVTSLVNDRNNELAITNVNISPVLLGDVNLDGFVDNNDLSLLNKHIAGAVYFNDTQRRAANVDDPYDDLVDLNDVIKLARYLDGIINSLS